MCAVIKASALKNIAIYRGFFFGVRKSRRVLPSLPLSQYLRHMLGFLFSLPDGRGLLVGLRGIGPQLLNYESPPSFTFIYRCAIPLDLPPRFSRLLFLFFVPSPSNLLFRREIPLRLLSMNVRPVRSPMRATLLHCIKLRETHLRLGQSQAINELRRFACSAEMTL